MTRSTHKRIVNQRKLDRAFVKVYKDDALRNQFFKCPYCLGKLTYKSSTIEHKKSKFNGGNNKRDNIAASCAKCNHTKSETNHPDFVKKLDNPLALFQPVDFIGIWVSRRLNRALNKLSTN